MNKYKEFLQEAKDNYIDCSFEELVEYLKEFKEYKKHLQNVIPFENSLTILKDNNTKIMKLWYNDNESFTKIIDLLLESCEKEINMIKALLYEMIEEGGIEDE